MKAVNLIPADSKPSAAGRSGGGVYVLLGGLAVLVVLVGAMVSSGNTVRERKAELARVEAQATAAEAKAAALAPYTRFTQLREARVQTVSSLVGSRFDWSTVFHETARVIPSDAWLTGMKGIVEADGSGSAAAPAAGGKVPKIEITGCTSGHKSVARMMVRLRLMDRVAKVTLTSSSRASATAGAAGGAAGAPAAPAPAPEGGAAGGLGCQSKKGRAASFAVTVTFNPVTPTAAAAAPSTAPVLPAATGAPK